MKIALSWDSFPYARPTGQVSELFMDGSSYTEMLLESKNVQPRPTLSYVSCRYKDTLAIANMLGCYFVVVYLTNIPEQHPSYFGMWKIAEDVQ